MATSDFFSELWQMLIGRVQGPFALRLIVQPVVASVLAIRAGLNDARENRAPYLWSAFSSPHIRYALAHQGWKDIRTVFVMAVVLDAAYQVVEFRWVFLGQVVIVAVVLAVVPYVLLRGPVTRLMSKRRKSS